MTALMAYLGTGVNGMSFTYWSWNPDSGDTGGIVQDDWVTVNTNKQNIVGPYLIPPVGSTATSSPTSTGTAGTSACSVTYTVTSTWVGGFQSSVVVKNTGTATITNWHVGWTVPSGVTLGSGWSATFVTSGSNWTMTAPSYAATLAPGASFTFGFTANGPSTPSPSNITCS
jgi:endoglucanase